jgi:hypothetical protein
MALRCTTSFSPTSTILAAPSLSRCEKVIRVAPFGRSAISLQPGAKVALLPYGNAALR